MTATKTKRASYREGVRWIADNDEPSSIDRDEIAGFISTLLLADLFGKEPEDVAAAIVRARLKCPHGCRGTLRWVDDQFFCPTCRAEWAHETITGVYQP